MSKFTFIKDDILFWQDMLNNPKKYFLQYKKNFKNINNLELKNSISTNNTKDIVLNDVTKIDKTISTKIRQGKIEVNDILDLHHYYLNEAEEELTNFIINSYNKKLRVLLVITGKGKYIEEAEKYYDLPNGSIRNNFIKWINYNNLKPYILAITFAHRNHGGEGAFYIILKKYS